MEKVKLCVNINTEAKHAQQTASPSKFGSFVYNICLS